MGGIIVAFPKQADADKIKGLLIRNGFSIYGACTTGAQAIQYANVMEWGIVICAYKLQDMTCVQLRDCLPRQIEMLTLASKRVWDLCYGENIVCLELPLKTHELIAALEMTMHRSAKRKKQSKSAARQRNAKEKEWIMKAKLLLMEKNNLTEEDAYRYIQKCSMDSGTNMAETAQMLLELLNI